MDIDARIDRKKKERIYQLSDVFEDTDIITEVVGDLKFKMKLKQLSKRRRAGRYMSKDNSAGGGGGHKG